MVNILGTGERGRGPLQLDIGIVVSGLGGNSNEERSQLNGLVSFFGVDFGLYIGPSYNPFRTVGPSIGIGVVIGSNGFLAAKLGIHFRRAFGLAMLFPIVPIYGVTGAGFLAALPVSEGVKVAATVPLLLVPAAAVYREDIHKMHIRGMDALMKLKSHIRGK
ncbi:MULTISPECIES: hypothetical protein [Methanosarcina]|jgi:hypothetical protein|uniref:Uncharacterized protein n=3 Tax=Methanosarcina mazei TaxID=2209 RepID=A0A0F8IEZ7_METMZ|nr:MULTISPECIES: hypothetical protein [Methanosarcina]AAM32470.1 conserved protein [Methanosarcina mazei Go1]AKB68519.1 hypothetical protein MSMAL_1976 [Methanosarcina mazei LYC]KKG87716.1 hypothetical protein DU69_07455 [Methanosarcina mazei]MDY0246179.1 hypothetical protein [Methanosarcina mazei]WIM42706.1 hypothetical protein PSF70_14595 [Methanosarcina mazei]